MGIKGEVSFFRIELSPMFGFGHGTKKKQNSYAMQLIKPSTSGHLGCFDMMVILASMGDTRQRVHMSDPLFYSSLSLLSRPSSTLHSHLVPPPIYSRQWKLVTNAILPISGK
jgi:hypothetical protein